MIKKPYYSRYKVFSSNGSQITVPFIKLDVKKTDKVAVWKSAESRMDKISFKYYGDPTYGWLILLANPSFGFEFDIPNNTIIKIPYPLNDTINEYNQKSIDFSKNN